MEQTTRVYGGESLVKLCAVQMDPKFGCKQENLQKTLELCREAAAQGAQVIVLPELCTTGWVFNTRREVFDMAEQIPGGPSTRAWEQLAAELGVYICAGIAELAQDGSHCYNAAVLIGPQGLIGVQHKLHLWNDDKYFFEPGDTSYQVFETPIGRIGMLICNDMWFFESFRLLALMGVDLVCCPAAWIDLPPMDPPMGAQLAKVNAGCNHISIVASDRVGVERGVEFPGCSCIINANGYFTAGPASRDKTELLLAEVNLTEARNLNITGLNVTFRDRRTDLYDEMLGSGLKKLPR